ncbi:MAG: tRNA (adenosine(37)-N6)-dimethylallyltransferase MiaA [Flavobacteriales bacterium]|nr:MAG: tRNA (adenosine(37)-N6)-dimethylallyltransferase MiaA [Flavobacteriales bacterium]
MTTNNRPLLVVITGPTAVGKTDICVKIAQYFDTEIISADSRQLYKELSIGTAKPSATEMQNIKHHFIGSHSIQEDYNVNDFEKEALTLLDKLFLKHKIIILTGGSGLYINALCEGFDEKIPGSDDIIRAELNKMYNKYGIQILQEKLKQLDPIFYNEIDLNNVKRIQRAIEVCMITGGEYSKIRQGNKQNRNFRVLKIGLNRNREELFGRINQRVDLMLHNGLLDEVESVIKYRDKNPLKTVGYTELFDYLDNITSLQEATEKIKVNTRRYAKRQLGWFKKNEDYKWFHPNYQEEIINYISINLI